MSDNTKKKELIVINDLLSFLSCKIKHIPREKLLKTIQGYYPESDILSAQKTLLQSLPEKKSTRHGRCVKHPDPLIAMYDCFQLIPDEDLPVFACKNLNNVPHLNIVKTEPIDEASVNEQHIDIKEEQETMKSQMADIADVVQQIKDQLKHIVSHQVKGRIVQRIKRKKECSKDDRLRRKAPRRTVAYLQQLIDEEEMNRGSSNDAHDNESDCMDDLLSDEEKDLENAVCQVILREGEENCETRETKIEGEKIIYIKNEEEFLLDDYDELRMDENMIEISPNLDGVNSSSKVGQQESVIMVSHYGENKLLFTCTGCSLSSKNSQTFNGHKCSSSTVRKKKNSSYGYVCSVCHFETPDVAHFNEHMLAHYDMLPEEGFECILCVFKSNNYEDYRAHLLEHSWVRPYHCQSCPYKCSKELRYKNHTIRHLEYKGPNHFECIICGKICGTRNTMEKHRQMHKRNFDFRCEYCGITFRHRSALSQHILLSHTKERTFVCSVCNCLYDSQHSLDIHMKVHFKDNFFTCHVCGEKIKSKTTYRNHILMKHSEVKDFKCETCGEAFTFKHTLLMHRKRHENRLYSCHYCNKTFKCLSYLKIHCDIHEGKKPFKCPHCDFESSSKTALKKHLPLHDDPYLLSCVKCPFMTNQLSEFHRHKSSHNSDDVTKETFVEQVMLVMAE